MTFFNNGVTFFISASVSTRTVNEKKIFLLEMYIFSIDRV